MRIDPLPDFPRTSLCDLECQSGDIVSVDVDLGLLSVQDADRTAVPTVQLTRGEAHFLAGLLLAFAGSESMGAS